MIDGNDFNTAARTIVRPHGRFHPASTFNPTTQRAPRARAASDRDGPTF